MIHKNTWETGCFYYLQLLVVILPARNKQSKFETLKLGYMQDHRICLTKKVRLVLNEKNVILDGNKYFTLQKQAYENPDPAGELLGKGENPPQKERSLEEDQYYTLSDTGGR